MLPSLEEISRKRRILGLTQNELAKLAGVSQSLIAKMESRKTNPSYTKVKAILDVLNKLEMKMEVHALEIFHGEIVSVQKNEAVSKAVRLMMEHGYSQIPVFDGEHAVGSISEKTILSQVSAGKDLSQVSALSIGEVMDEAFPQVGEDAPLPLISGLLQVYPAVLVTKKGKVVGIITKADLLKMLL
ncbi:MAG: CBS domain-containing protein [Candidatus Bathyarchaeota archaeon]|nr:MAG: CBS domain-containing protein [Candidatus Bathyarchaeota archaeon]